MGAITRWIDQSLRRRIAVLVSGLALVLGVGAVLFSAVQVHRITRELYTERLVQLGRQLAPLLGRSPLEAETRLRRLASEPAVVALAKGGTRPDSLAADQLVTRAVPGDPRVSVVVLNESDRPVLYAHEDSLPDWLGPAPSGSELDGVGPFRLHDTTAFFDIRIPIRDGPKVVGSLVRRVRDPWSGTNRAAVLGLAGEGTGIVVGSSETGVWSELGTRVNPPPDLDPATDGVSTVAWDNTSYLVNSIPIEGTPWRLVTRIDSKIVREPALGFLRRGGLVALAVVLFGTLAGIGLGRRLSRPLQAMTEVAEQIASAEDPRSAPENSPGEVGRLARAFNAMVERVASSTRRLRDNEASHRAFVSYASDGIWRVEFVPPASATLAPKVQIESWYRLAPRAEGNPALVRMSGREPDGEMDSLPLAELFPPADPAVQRMWLDFVRNGYRAADVELVTPGPDDTRRIFVNDLVGVVDGGGLRRIWGTRRDVTLSRIQDQRLAQTDRLEAIGRLAGGVAHDFNNLLTAIVGYAEPLQEALPPEHPHHQDAAEINRIALRAAELTKQLLAFSRGQVMRPSLIDLNAVIRSAENLLRRMLPDGVELHLALDDGIDAIEIDPGQLERVIVNLVVNARDAMPEGGRIELGTSTTMLGDDILPTRPGLRPGEYVTLTVRDTGTGMSEEVRQHVFEPFYTTKPKGRGTGLGLSTVYGVMRQSGGDITVASELGVGTTFTLYLPVKGKIAVAPVEGPMGSEGPGIITMTGTESVLVVEDEAPVREVVRRALTASGYQVMIAGDAIEALRIEEQGNPIHLVLTDMILPGQNGSELAMELRRRRPGILLLVMSGFTGEYSMDIERMPEGAGYLSKPFSLADLRRRVREVLDG